MWYPSQGPPFRWNKSGDYGARELKIIFFLSFPGQKAAQSTQMVGFLNQLGLRSSSESCSQFKVSYAGPKCVKQQWISMGLVSFVHVFDELPCIFSFENIAPGKKFMKLERVVFMFQSSLAFSNSLCQNYTHNQCACGGDSA